MSPRWQVRLDRALCWRSDDALLCKRHDSITNLLHARIDGFLAWLEQDDVAPPLFRCCIARVGLP